MSVRGLVGREEVDSEGQKGDHGEQGDEIVGQKGDWSALMLSPVH